MSVETQKLELISWIADLNDPAEIKEVYEQLKKKMKVRASRRKSEEKPQQAAIVTPASQLEKITDAYLASEEPDLNLDQIFTDRLIAYERKIDFD